MMLQDMQPWEYQVASGLVLRGWHATPRGKPVLHFVHGNGFCGLTYEHVLAPLQSHYDLFISDMQGHGDSDAGETYLGWNANAELLAEVWRHHAPLWSDVPHIACGHSYGAVLSTLVMGRHPQLFDAAILLDPTYAPPPMMLAFSVLGSLGLMQHLPLARQARVRSVAWPDAEALWEYFYQRGVFKGWQDACLQSYLDHAMRPRQDGSFALKCPPTIEAAIFASYTPHLWQAIRAIRVPVRAMVGEQSFPFIHKALPKIRRANAHFTFERLPGGHCFMQEAPHRTASAMRDALTMMLRQISVSYSA